MERYLILSDGKSMHTLKWAKELKKYYDVYILTFTDFIEEFVQSFAEDRLYSLHTKISANGGNYKVISLIPEVVDIIQQINPHVVHAHYITSYGVVSAIIKKLYRIPATLILSTWGTDILVTPHKNKLYWYITRFALSQADIITSDSHAMSDEIKLICNRQALTFPFGLEKFPACMIEDKDEFLYFSNRSLGKNYNIDKIIIFFAELVRENQKRKLIIANDGPQKEDLMNLVGELGLTDNVNFVGFLNREQQNQFYAKSQFYLSIPTSDATSVSLLEAMAFGCIPIVSNIQSNREWIINNFNGFYINDSVESLERLFRNKERIYDTNRLIIKEKALWENNIKIFLKQLNLRILGERAH